MAAAACVIRIERRDDGRYRAVCTLLPDFEAVADTEEEARQAVAEALRRHLAARLGGETL